MIGARITDAVEFFRQREEYRNALRMVRDRAPEGRRWRAAVHRVSGAAAGLHGRERVHVEEPLREVVLDLGDSRLRTEVVLDARRVHLDLDRGEILAQRTFGDLRRAAFLASLDLDLVRRHVALPDDFFAPIDVAGVVVVAQAMSQAFARREQRLVLELPVDDTRLLTPREQGLRAQVERDHAERRRWSALASTLLDDSGT